MYKKFNETRRETIILDEWVEMVWTGQTRSYYESLGYEYTGYLDKFWVHIDDLAENSNVVVTVQCPICLETRKSRRSQTLYSGHTICRGCTKALDLTGIRFGRWTVLYPHKIVSGHFYWMCECECGNVKSVQGASLIKGHTTSCGCYRSEWLSSLVGEKHPTWKDPVFNVCEYCGEEYEVEPWEANERRFCSSQCVNKWRGETFVGANHPNWKGGKIVLNCDWCGSEYEVVRARVGEARFCSRKCVGAWNSVYRVGENHHNWDSSIPEEQRYVDRNYQEYKQYIKDVMKRDNYTCQICGTTENVEVHHMYSYTSYPEYATNVDFGLVMCEKDHKAFHAWLGGYGISCVPSDIDRWLYEIQ